MQDYILRLAKVSGTSIECINMVKYKNSTKSWVLVGPGSSGPLFIPTPLCPLSFIALVDSNNSTACVYNVYFMCHSVSAM